MIIRPARMDDVEVIMTWRRERVTWLAAKGEEQWSIPLPRSAVAATVSAGQTWMVWNGYEPVATITLTAYVDVDGLWKPDRDPEALWYPEDDPADALYAAKMMIPLRHKGENLGGEMLHWASGRAYEAGLTWLRLDAWTTNLRLHKYYLRQGFRHVRTVASRVSGACFQRPSQPYTGCRLKSEPG
ncbi:GCN5 family acetyltransferase [Micromonospora aurantiaca (nom. illeg.)]|uniref:GCN5 family acetyltransferase n=2 Tax=Micromonospora aurantiaca (nom. illeg.) TaxID=47850 RepID=UPI0033DC8281